MVVPQLPDGRYAARPRQVATKGGMIHVRFARQRCGPDSQRPTPADT